MSEEFLYVSVEKIPFKIDYSSASAVSRLIPSENRLSVVERPVTDEESVWYSDRAEEAYIVSREKAEALALRLK